MKVYEKEDALYDISIKEKIGKKSYEMWRSNNEAWGAQDGAEHEIGSKDTKGKRVHKIIDNGNGIKIDGKFMEYHEFSELLIIMNLVNEKENISGKIIITDE